MAVRIKQQDGTTKPLDGQQTAAPASPDAQEGTAETQAAMVAKMPKDERMELLKAIKKAELEDKKAERAKKVRRLSCELPIELMDALEQRAKDETPQKTVTRIVIKALKLYLDTPLPEPMPADHLKVLLSDK